MDPIVSGSNVDRPIAQVAAGMRVVDDSGDEVGTVDVVRMGDAEAATVGGGDLPEGRTLMTNVSEAVLGVEPDVAPELAERMLRVGYVKIDTKGLFTSARYALADEISGVDGDTVRLSVAADALARKGAAGY